MRVGRDHRVELTLDATAGIYLQGATEHTHGLTSTLLSTTAVRSGEILDSLLAHRTQDGAAQTAWGARTPGRAVVTEPTS